jgi:single-strand DNA-binding protein
MYQKIVIVGNLGRDPEMRYMPDGTAVTSFSVATNRRWTDRASGQPVDETTWFRVSVWGRQAETANEYLSKGRKVLVEGQLTPDRNTGGPRLWTAQDGTVRSSFEVRADTVRFIGGRDDMGDSFDDGGDSYEAGTPAQEEDDIPF